MILSLNIPPRKVVMTKKQFDQAVQEVSVTIIITIKIITGMMITSMIITSMMMMIIIFSR